MDEDDKVKDVVKAREFQLIDANDNPCARLSMNNKGVPCLMFTSPDGQIRSSISSSGLDITSNDNPSNTFIRNGMIGITGKDNNLKACISSSIMGTGLLLTDTEVNDASVNLNIKDGKPRLDISDKDRNSFYLKFSTPDGSPSITMYSEDSSINISFYEGSPRIELSSECGKGLVVNVGKDDSSSIVLSDSEGLGRIWLTVDKNDSPTLDILGNDANKHVRLALAKEDNPVLILNGEARDEYKGAIRFGETKFKSSLELGVQANTPYIKKVP